MTCVLLRSLSALFRSILKVVSVECECCRDMSQVYQATNQMVTDLVIVLGTGKSTVCAHICNIPSHRVWSQLYVIPWSLA